MCSACRLGSCCAQSRGKVRTPAHTTSGCLERSSPLNPLLTHVDSEWHVDPEHLLFRFRHFPRSTPAVGNSRRPRTLSSLSDTTGVHAADGTAAAVPPSPPLANSRALERGLRDCDGHRSRQPRPVASSLIITPGALRLRRRHVAQCKATWTWSCRAGSWR